MNSIESSLKFINNIFKDTLFSDIVNKLSQKEISLVSNRLRYYEMLSAAELSKILYTYIVSDDKFSINNFIKYQYEFLSNEYLQKVYKYLAKYLFHSSWFGSLLNIKEHRSVLLHSGEVITVFTHEGNLFSVANAIEAPETKQPIDDKLIKYFLT